MGNSSLILVLAVGITLGIFAYAITERNTQAVQNSISYYKKTRAKNIAASAAEIYLKDIVGSNDTTTGAFSLSSIMDGKAAVTIWKPKAFRDSMLLLSVGTFEKQAESVLVVLKPLPEIPEFNGVMAVSNGANASIQSTGVHNLDGRNYTMDGTSLDAGCSDVHAITYNPAPTINHSGTWLNSGSGGGPMPADTEFVGSQPNFDALALQLASLADTVITWNISTPATYGNPSKPMIVLVKPPGKGSQDVTGAGVFIMDLRGATGDMQFNGQLQWTGLVIVIGDPTGQYAAKWTNARPCVGAILLTGAKPNWSTTNNLNMKFSCEAISMALWKVKNYSVFAWRD